MFTGERILPGGKFNVTYQESLFAYEFTGRRAAGKRVLDVGSGEGYGVAYLAERADRVVGLDPHRETVEAAAAKYARPNIQFVHGTLDRPAAEIAGESFEIVCCFQTIEHVWQQDEFLERLKRLATPGGEVIITTPNKGRFPGFNPYHVRELTADELTVLMARHFRHFRVRGVFGSETVLQYKQAKQKISNAVLRLDVLRAREWLPHGVVVGLYTVGAGMVKSLSYHTKPQIVKAVSLQDFWVADEPLNNALDLLAVGVVEE